MKRLLTKAALISALAAGSLSAYAKTEIQWWHSMGGSLNEWVNDLANQFNASQEEYKVVPVFKGEYPEALSAGIAAFRAGNAPDILQVFEVGTATMIYAKGVTKSVSEIMKAADVPFDPNHYIPAVSSYYTAPNGEMLSLPFNSSTTVLYYNKDAFQKAGLDPEKAPKTWKEVRSATEALKKSGHSCPMTISWIGWTQLESFSAWHDVPYATKNNGFDGLDARLAFNSPLHVRHIENLANMAKEKLFVYHGRESASQPAFISGECAIFMGSSGSYAGIKRDAKFNFGESTLPYYEDVAGAPQNTIIGGASLWVLAGKPESHYKGIAKFFDFISQPQVQSNSHMRTGYLPVTLKAYELTEQSGFYKENPGTDVPVEQMVRKTTDRTRGVRLGNMPQIRTIVDEELEQVWTGKKTAQQALDSAVKRGNVLLERFESVNK
ncbi:sn-glycerol-3-phosphate ABC transporter substrate-binding protein UgpB [Conservatibacter flavescens]|uniref:sn-glycerol-3-phosphate-binding periplasmic protein UgpB n=1 Tax=Conservatibacter flavescens TaxID=28161 RepID=A0A2M8S4G6_9PAST|nr:sn-glycerol-3-phosphate ABC transporter substrate-binding protein UgpB [Conservatibacter flavescens]PJG86030.1 sn-glycerol-3-phosphate ABC transporter substrate-binding protein UgpB [Conservatibacter flavescens]